MGWTHKLGIALSAIAGRVGFYAPPSGEVARQARVAELYADYRTEFAEVPELTPARLRADLEADVAWVVVDVRPAAEREVSVIPGAVDAARIEGDPGAWRDRRLVAYCTIGYRSGLWAQRQRAAGLDVANLAGGVLGWSRAGGSFVDAAGPTARVHVYGPTWDLLPSGYEAVW